MNNKTHLLIRAGRIAAFRHSIRNIKKLKEYQRILEEMPGKTDLEINALKGLKRSLVCKRIVAMIAVIGICLGTWVLCMGMSGELDNQAYEIETSVVKDGYIKYGVDDALYDVSDLDYEEGTWLNIYINKDTGEVEMVKDMFRVKNEEAQKQNRLLLKGAMILGVTIVFLIVGLIIALGILEKPFRKWHQIYSQQHPGI